MSSSFSNEETLFDEALALPAGERAAYLDQACAGNRALRERLEILLAAHEAPEGTLGQPGTRLSRPADEVPGARIGRYRLLQIIGEGGCGIVYMAEQLEPVHRRVALKIIKLGMDTREVIARFEAERQALALMDHPNIAKVLDAGATETGRPYFVMELVRGVPITRFCDEKNSSTEERLTLFLRVCHAVQHAHQKGIIHRDLKPSNILVAVSDGGPVPKIIDFGIAKAAQGRLTDHTVFTAFEQFVGTPAYMSPEQAVMTSLDVDTRSDVYSLGVLLYELLTGCTPFDAHELAQAGVDEIRRRIREIDPPRPSTRLSTMEGDVLQLAAQQRQTVPPQLISSVRGDLDWIVMRCLEKDRSRRYETANGLAEDIARHLQHRPVAASPPSTAYLVGKFVRRHQAAFAAGSAIAAALVLGLFAATWQAVRATRAELQATLERNAAETARRAETKARELADARRAEAEAAQTTEREQRQIAEAKEKIAEVETARSRQVARFMKEMLKAVGPRVALGRDTKLLRDVLDETVKRLGRDLAGLPTVETEMCTTLGSVYVDLGEYARGVAMFERALGLCRAQSDAKPADAVPLLGTLGRVLQQWGKYREAEAYWREALAIEREVDSETLGYTMGALAQILSQYGKPAEAEALWRERLARAQRRPGQPSMEWANALAGLGYGLAVLPGSDPKEREALLLEAAQMFKALGRDGLGALNSMAWSLGSAGKLAEAESNYRDLIPRWRETLGREEHPDLITPLSNFASILRKMGKVSEAESLYREVLHLTRRFFSDDHPMLAQSLGALADHFLSCGRPSDAEGLLKEAVALRRKYLGNQHSSLRIGLFQLGFILKERGQPAEAEPFLREALAIARATGSKDYNASVMMKDLAQIVLDAGKPQEAEALARESLAIREKLFPPGSWYIANARSILGDALLAQRRYAEAEPLMVASFAALKEGELKPLTVAAGKVRVRAAGSLVMLYRETNQPSKAAEWQQVLAQAESELGGVQPTATSQPTNIAAPDLPPSPRRDR